MVAVTRGRSNGTRFAAFATSAALVILLFAHGPSPTSAQSCLSISGSSACPDFTAYSISQKDPDSPKSVADFDTYITSSLVSIINTYGCNLTSADSLRYLQSSFCGLIIDTAKSDGCNQGISSSQLCVSTVKNFVSSLQTVFADSTLCPNPLTTQMNTFTTMFTTLQGRLTSDDPAVCIVGENAEGSQCGFPTTDAALDYCNNVANGNDQCCTKVAGFTGTVNPPSQVVQATTQTTAAATTQQAVPTTASAPTQTAKSTTSNSSTSSAMSPVMMIGIGVGAILIIVVATVLVVRSRRQKGKKVAAGGYNMSRQGAAGGAGSRDGSGRHTPTKMKMRPETADDVFRSNSSTLKLNEAGSSASGQNHLGPPLPTYQANAAYPPRGPSPSSFNRPPQQQTPPFRNDGAAFAQQSMPQPFGETPSQYTQPFSQEYQQPQAKGAPMASNFVPSQSQPLPPAVPAATAFAGQLPPALGAAPAMPAPQAGDGETYEVVYNYIPQLSDEIYLYVGDPVVLKCRYDDGWAYGLNLTTNEEGSFPIACLAGFSESDPQFMPLPSDSGNTAPPSANTQDNFSYKAKKRASSMFGPMSGGSGNGNYKEPVPIIPGSREPPTRQPIDRASIVWAQKRPLFDSVYEPLPTAKGAAAGASTDSVFYDNYGGVVTDSQYFGKKDAAGDVSNDGSKGGRYPTDSEYYGKYNTDSQYYGSKDAVGDAANESSKGGRYQTDSEYYGKFNTDSQYYGSKDNNGGNVTDSVYYGGGGNTDSQYFGNNTDSQYYGNNTDSQYYGNNTDSQYYGNGVESEYFGPSAAAQIAAAANSGTGATQGAASSTDKSTIGAGASNSATGPSDPRPQSEFSEFFGAAAKPSGSKQTTDSQYYGESAAGNTDSRYYAPTNTDSMYYGNNTDSQYYGKATDSQYYGNNTDSQYYGNNTDSQYFGNNNTDSQYYGNNTDSQYYGNNTDSQYYGNSNNATDSVYYGQGGGATDSVYYGKGGDGTGGKADDGAGGRGGYDSVYYARTEATASYYGGEKR